MATPAESMRLSAMRAAVYEKLQIGVGTISPTLAVLLGGVPNDKNTIPLIQRLFKNVLWSQGGSSADWRVVKTRSKATQSKGPLRTRNFVAKDLCANPSVQRYMFDATYGVGEGDLAENRHAGPHKLLDIKKASFDDAMAAVAADVAASAWAVNETNQAGGLTMFSPTNVAASTTYAGIAMNATATNGTDTFYYWRPTGYDYGTLTIAANLLAITGGLINSATVSEGADGTGRRIKPDAMVCDETLWPYVLSFVETKMSLNAPLKNLTILADTNADNVILHGVPLFWDANFGGATGYVDGSATEEILAITTDKFKLSTTNTKAEGLMTAYSTSDKDRSWLAGQGGVVLTGMQAPMFLDPRCFQVAYT